MLTSQGLRLRAGAGALAALVAVVLGLGAVPVMTAAPAAATVLHEREFNDIVGEELPLGATMVGSIDVPGSCCVDMDDYDVFYTDLPADARVHLSLKFPAGLAGRAYRVRVSDARRLDRQEFVLDGTHHDGAWLASQAFYMPAGRMHVQVYGTSDLSTWGAEYRLAVTVTPGQVETEDNDYLVFADPAPLGTTVRGSASLYHGTDRDFYVTDLSADARVHLSLTFPAGLAGEAYTVRVWDASETLRQVFSLDGTHHDGVWLGSQVFFMPKGSVYVEVSGTSRSSVWGKEYRLTVTSTPGRVETEPNDSLAESDAVPLGTTVLGSVLGTDPPNYDDGRDVDHFHVHVPAAGRVRLELRFPAVSAGAAYDVAVYDALYTTLAEFTVEGASGSGTTVRRKGVRVPAGRVYVVISGDKGRATWGKQYSLRVDPGVAGPTPTVKGTANVGRRLTAVPGAWTSGATLRYQWFRAGTAIRGATARSYRVVKADAGRELTVRVTGTRSGFTPYTRSSKARTVAQYAPTVSVSKVAVQRSVRGRVTVQVRTAATARPTGRVSVRVAGRTVTARLSAKARGKVVVRLPRISSRGTRAMRVTFAPTGWTKVSTSKGSVRTTVRVR